MTWFPSRSNRGLSAFNSRERRGRHVRVPCCRRSSAPRTCPSCRRWPTRCCASPPSWWRRRRWRRRGWTPTGSSRGTCPAPTRRDPSQTPATTETGPSQTPVTTPTGPSQTPVTTQTGPSQTPVTIDKLARVQRRATKLIPELRILSYEDRVQQCKLTNLETWVRGDQIEVFKITHRIEGLDRQTTEHEDIVGCWLKKGVN